MNVFIDQSESVLLVSCLFLYMLTIYWLLVNGAQKRLKYLPLSSAEQRNLYRFLTTWGLVNYVKIFIFWGSIHLMLNIHFPYWLPNLIRNIHLLVNELKSWATNHDTMLMLHICGTRATLLMCFTSLFFSHIWRIILPTPDTSWYKM